MAHFLADLDDDLEALNAEAVQQEQTFKVPCQKCNGTGRWRPGYSCFACKGRGFHERKHSAADLAAKRQYAAQRKEKKQQEALASFMESHPAAYAWLTERSGSFDFAASLLETLRKYGELTENQMAAVERCMAKDAERAQAKQQRLANAPTVDVTPMQEAFATAQSNGLKNPKLRLPGYIFSLAPAHGQNAGAIYVKAGETYQGKLMNGKFFASRDCSSEAEILALCADPMNAAVAYGQRTGSCAICGRELTDGDSIDRGIGPICAAKFGF